MATYLQVRNIGQWEPLSTGEIIQMTGARNLLEIKGTGRVSVYVADNQDMKNKVLLGSGDVLEIGYTFKPKHFVQFVAYDGAEIWVANIKRTQVVARIGCETYTSIEPKGRRNSDFDRMMHMVKLNEQRRERQLSEEIAAIRALREPAPEVVDDGDKPKKPAKKKIVLEGEGNPHEGDPDVAVVTPKKEDADE